MYKVDVPASWTDAEDDCSEARPMTATVPSWSDFVNNVLDPVNAMQGDDLPVSTFVELRPTAPVPQGTAAYEKRGIAVDVPEWDAGQLHPVQPVLLCVPPCGHPSHRYDR